MPFVIYNVGQLFTRSSPGHQQDIICCVAFARSSLRRIVYTSQSSLPGALHLTPGDQEFRQITRSKIMMKKLTVDLGTPDHTATLTGIALSTRVSTSGAMEATRPRFPALIYIFGRVRIDDST